MQDWAPRLIETWKTEGQGIGGGGQGSRSRGAESTRAARGHLRSRQQGRMRWMLVSSQHEAEEKGFKTGTGAETRQDRGRWDHRALGWELQPESWKKNKGQECWSMMGLGGGCHPVPPITTFTLRWPSRMELNHSPASVRSLHVPGVSLPWDLWCHQFALMAQSCSRQSRSSCSSLPRQHPGDAHPMPPALGVTHHPMVGHHHLQPSCGTSSALREPFPGRFGSEVKGKSISPPTIPCPSPSMSDTSLGEVGSLSPLPGAKPLGQGGRSRVPTCRHGYTCGWGEVPGTP